MPGDPAPSTDAPPAIIGDTPLTPRALLQRQLKQPLSFWDSLQAVDDRYANETWGGPKPLGSDTHKAEVAKWVQNQGSKLMALEKDNPALYGQIIAVIRHVNGGSNLISWEAFYGRLNYQGPNRVRLYAELLASMSDLDANVMGARYLAGSMGGDEVIAALFPADGIKPPQTKPATANVSNVAPVEYARSAHTVTVVSNKVGHPEQQIPNEPHSIGGDVYAAENELGIAPELVAKYGRLVVLRDTATNQGSLNAGGTIDEADPDSEGPRGTQAALDFSRLFIKN